MRPTAWAVTRPPGFFRRSASTGLVYARHGRELMGCKSPVRESSHCRDDRVNQVLAEGKGVSARRGLEEAGAQSYEPTNRNSIQGHHPDKSAQHDEAHGFRRNGKCCGCVATVHVLIRGDLSRLPSFPDGAASGNSCRDGAGVSRSHSRCGRCRQRCGNWKQARRRNR